MAGGDVQWSNATSRPLAPGRLHPGAVIWDVVSPHGEVSGPGIAPGQRGYAERLTLRVAPWRLGIEILRWGRFCGARSSLAWIEWIGQDPVALALEDGRASGLRQVSPEGVSTDRAELIWAPCRPFLEEPLASGLLHDMPWPRRIRPLAFLAGIERKYASQGRLRLADGTVEDGDVVFEDVTWPG